jgi:carbamate kinase
MTDRTEIIQTYLGLVLKAQAAEYYFENETGSLENYFETSEAMVDYKLDNGITQEELDAYHDSRRNVTKVDNVDDAFSAMQKIFG